MSWSRKDPHLLVRCCPHPRASSAIALSKCQVLIVSRSAHKSLVEERVRVNSVFSWTIIDQQAVEALPENGVPPQLLECAVQMPEVDKYDATRCGPGTIRDPLDTAQADDDASDEISDASSNEGLREHAAGESASSVGQPAPKTSDPQLNQCETRLLVWIRHLHQTLYNMWPLSKLNWIW